MVQAVSEKQWMVSLKIMTNNPAGLSNKKTWLAASWQPKIYEVFLMVINLLWRYIFHYRTGTKCFAVLWWPYLLVLWWPCLYMTFMSEYLYLNKYYTWPLWMDICAWTNIIQMYMTFMNGYLYLNKYYTCTIYMYCR